ncbi:MAG: GGDEF domain-containing protein [Myxococcota bacterium]
MDSDIKTRVTSLEELKSPQNEGQDCLVVIYAADPRIFGRRHVLDAEPVLLGRGAENTLVLEGDSISRRHARIERRSNGYYVLDLQSTNGTYVNDELIDQECQLRRGDQIKIGDTILKFLSGSDVEAQYHETIYRMTIVDGLTGVHNKRYLMETLDREISRARRHQRPLSLMMFDIDRFKQINDTLGHLAGDYILKEMAQAVRARLRPDDVVARYGGEEFAVVLPETATSDAMDIAERIRQLIDGHPFEFEHERIHVTVSAGVAELQEGMDVMQLVKAADERLYEAKRNGRNRVCK